jgi:HK97 family phage major capsid protein
MKLRELRTKRGQLVTRMQELSNADTMSAEQSVEFDRLDKEASELRSHIERIEKSDALAAEMAQREARTKESTDELRTKNPDAAKRVELEERAFRALLINGKNDMPEELRAALREQRAQSIGTTTTGGFTIPQAFGPAIEIALKYSSAVLSVAGVMDTDTGATMPYPTLNDAGVLASIVGENTASADQDATFGSVSFGAWVYRTMGRIPEELLQDSAFDLAALMAEIYGSRIGRAANAHFTTGNGTTQPQGFVAAATAGVTLPTGNTTSITYDGVVDLVYSLDPAYRSNRQSCVFMASDSALRVIRKLKDTQNRPIWDGGLRDGETESIMGYRVVVNNDMAAPAANVRSVAFGDFSKYKIRRVRGYTVKRLEERFADALQIGILAFARMDGKMLDAGTGPIRVLIQSAT